MGRSNCHCRRASRTHSMSVTRTLTELRYLSPSRRYFSCTSTLRAPTPPSDNARRYFYDIDEHGQLFLSGTKIKNFTSCYKDPVFLDFFYSRLKPLAWHTDEGEAQRRTLMEDGYSHLSLCGVERNYVRSVDTPIVFKELLSSEGEGGEKECE